MRCNNKGQATALEGILILVLIAVLAFVFWNQLNKKTQSNQFHDQAKQDQYTYSPGGIRLFDFSCARKGLFDDTSANKAHN